MNVPLVNENLYVRTLRNSNISYDIRHRQFDNQNSRGQKPDIPPRQGSLQTNHNMMTTDISTQLQCSRNMSTCHTFTWEYTPTPTSRHNKYIWQEKLSNSPIKTYQ